MSTTPTPGEAAYNQCHEGSSGWIPWRSPAMAQDFKQHWEAIAQAAITAFVTSVDMPSAEEILKALNAGSIGGIRRLFAASTAKQLAAKDDEWRNGLSALVVDKTLLQSQLTEATARAEELQATFDLQWRADLRAIKLWQAAHPGNELTWPDRCNLVVWLLEERARQVGQMNAGATILLAIGFTISWWIYPLFGYDSERGGVLWFGNEYALLVAYLFHKLWARRPRYNGKSDQ